MATTIGAMYSGKTHLALKNPKGRQNTDPMAVAAPAIACWFRPWSSSTEMKRSAGPARISPIAQEIEVHSKGETLELTIDIERWVSFSYL